MPRTVNCHDPGKMSPFIVITSPILKPCCAASFAPMMQPERSFMKASRSSGATTNSGYTLNQVSGSTAMRGQKFLKSLGSGPYTPPNQLAHDTVVTPGTRSISARSAVGSGKMNDTRCRTIMRLAEEPATPAFQAPTMVRSRPNAITAVAIPRIVRVVRSLWRKALRKMIDRIFMGPRLLQLALVEVAHNVRPLGGVRIMGDHDDGLFEFLVEALEQGENLLRRLAVEIARGLIRHEDRGVG